MPRPGLSAGLNQAPTTKHDSHTPTDTRQRKLALQATGATTTTKEA